MFSDVLKDYVGKLITINDQGFAPMTLLHIDLSNDVLICGNQSHDQSNIHYIKISDIKKFSAYGNQLTGQYKKYIDNYNMLK